MTMKLLLQTTIAPAADDWSIDRFALLASFLRRERDKLGRPLFDVTARDRDPPGSPDSLLSTLGRSDFDQLWLFAVDTGNGLSPEDCGGIDAFRARGGGLLIARDHMDLGCSVCGLAEIGASQHFHTRNVDSSAPGVRDDPYTLAISWPNFHSGANGDYQQVEVVEPAHEVMRDVPFLPSHPHEGAVSAPSGSRARVIARGRSKATGAVFNIAVAFEAEGEKGRAIAQSTFHHLVDYNWDPRAGAPSFVEEPSGDGMLRRPEARASVHRYARNVALWLARLPTD
ncbi:MAG: hypothetical protein WDO68_06300 [Gammaproteobacteria bacterium]